MTAANISRVRRGLARRMAAAGLPLKLRLRAAAAKSPRLARAYFALIDGSFSREQSGVLGGLERFNDNRPRRQDYLLRRNIHMIEKGLSMTPRRPLFALDYIEDTVAAYARARRLDDPDSQWAHDVLAAYFDTVSDHPTVSRARTAFSRGELAADPRSVGAMSPYARTTSPSPVAYDDLLALAERRRSVRWFLPKPVDRELIDKALAVATLSPSACNRQPFSFHVIDDPDRVHDIASIPMGTRGWSHNIPTFVVVVGELDAFFSERDRHAVYTDASLAIMAFVLALESLGLGSCCVNWPDIEPKERAMASALSLANYQRPIMCVAVGHPDPDGLVPFSRKLSPSELSTDRRSSDS